MDDIKKYKYRLGNQPEEYELKEAYISWTPEGTDWIQLCFRERGENKLTLINPKNVSDRKALFLHQIVIKDAFPLSFFGEERAKDWSHFAIVSDDESSEKFIIPMF